MKILALDFGDKRIGVALSDALGITAQSVGAIYRENDNYGFNFIRDLIGKEEIKEIVVGLPLNMNGSHGPAAKKAEDFADKLKNEFGLPVALWDERMTTIEAERVMIEGGASRGKRKRKIDKLAAQLILQSYLGAKGA
ncbi:MAG: Holliday junction resolvase RuvX [Candidatus Omnitrophota bacterium]